MMRTLQHDQIGHSAELRQDCHASGFRRIARFLPHARRERYPRARRATTASHKQTPLDGEEKRENNFCPPFDKVRVQTLHTEQNDVTVI